MRLLRVPDGSGTNLEEAVDDGGGLERRGGLLDTGDHFYIARVYSCVDMVTKAAVRRRGTWEDGEDRGRRSERFRGRARRQRQCTRQLSRDSCNLELTESVTVRWQGGSEKKVERAKDAENGRPHADKLPTVVTQNHRES